MTPDFDYFMRQKSFSPDLETQKKREGSSGLFGHFKSALRPNPLNEPRRTTDQVQALQMRDELFTKVEEQASRIASSIPEVDIEEEPETEEKVAEIDPRLSAKSMMIVLFVFVTLTTPTVLVRVGKMILHEDNFSEHWISSLATLSHFGASIANPIIYAIYREDFRNGFVNVGQSILSCCAEEDLNENGFY
jgi:hypothetical protein